MTSASDKKTDPSALKLNRRYGEVGERKETAVARAFVQPETTAARVIQTFTGGGVDVNELVDVLHEQTEKLKAGSTERLASTLVSQVHTLDALFGALAMRAERNMQAGHIESAEVIMRLALRAQVQTSRAIEVLAEMKHPRHIAFVAQANIAHGPQQVNNGVRQGPAMPAPHNEMKGQVHELHQDTGSPCRPGGTYTENKALVENHRTEDPRG